MQRLTGFCMLNSDQFARVKTLFAALCDLPPTEQGARLAIAGDDAQVIAEVRLLLEKTEMDSRPAIVPLASALSALADAPRSGDQLGAWTLCEEIGEGGMGKVFLARRSDGHFEQVAAVKLLAGLPSGRALRYLARERQILASLSHPNIARLLDGGSTPHGQPYLVMEYIQGLPMHDYCQQQGLSTAARLQLLIEVCAALAHAHQLLVVHCDLKPANILVTAGGRPLLLDFGISRLLDAADWAGSKDDEIAPQDSAVTGAAYTPRYASPEQKARERVGTATDIYSLGLVLAELLDVEWSEGKPLGLHVLPRELRDIVERATKPAMPDRYASADEFAADLRRYLTHQVVLARPPTAPYILRKWLRRNWNWTLAAMAFVAMLLGFSLQMRQQRDQALSAERTTRAVKDYMVSVFQGADPEMSGQRDLPVSELLNAGSARLQSALADQPQTRAELSSILGSVYQSIGQREQALELFDQAIALARTHAAQLVLAEVLHKKAYSLYDMGEFTAALPLAREALALRQEHAPEGIERIASMRLLGSILGYSGEQREAPQLLAQALELSTLASGAESIEAGLAHLDLARYFGGIGGHAEQVLQHASRAGEIFVRELGEQHFRVADALEIRILGMVQSGDTELAIPLAHDLTAKRTELYGEISHQRSYALHVLGSVLRRAGHHRQAIPVFQNSLHIHDQLDGPDSVASLVPTLNLAHVLEEAGAHDQALALFQRQLRIHLRHAAVTTITPLRLRMHIGRNLRLLGRLDEAHSELLGVLAAYRAEAKADPLERIDAQIEMAAVLRQRTELAGAETLLDSIEPGLLSEEPARRGWLAAERARIALARGMPEQAAPLYAQAQASIEAAFGKDAAEAWLLRIDEAEQLARSGADQAARALAIQIAAQVKLIIEPSGLWARRLYQLGITPASLQPAADATSPASIENSNNA